MRTSKKAFVSHNKRQRHNFLCGTTLVPCFARHSSARYRAHPVRSTSLLGFGALLRGDKHPGFLCCLAPSGSSLKRIFPCSCPRPGICILRGNLLMGRIVVPAKLQVQVGEPAGGRIGNGMLGFCFGGSILGGAHQCFHIVGNLIGPERPAGTRRYRQYRA